MNANERELVLKDEVYRIVGAAMEVSNTLGCGFLEAVYQEALMIEFNGREIPNIPQKQIDVFYKGHLLNKGYVADFLCYGKVIVEIKAMKTITPIEEAQVLNYLKATNLPVGLLLNFGVPQIEWRRFANTRRDAA